MSRTGWCRSCTSASWLDNEYIFFSFFGRRWDRRFKFSAMLPPRDRASRGRPPSCNGPYRNSTPRSRIGRVSQAIQRTHRTRKRLSPESLEDGLLRVQSLGPGQACHESGVVSLSHAVTTHALMGAPPALRNSAARMHAPDRKSQLLASRQHNSLLRLSLIVVRRLCCPHSSEPVNVFLRLRRCSRVTRVLLLVGSSIWTV